MCSDNAKRDRIRQCDAETESASEGDFDHRRPDCSKMSDNLPEHAIGAIAASHMRTRACGGGSYFARLAATFRLPSQNKQSIEICLKRKGRERGRSIDSRAPPTKFANGCKHSM